MARKPLIGWAGVIWLFLNSSAGLGQEPQSQEERIRQRWNRVFTADEPTFTHQHNELLARISRTLTPGTALDLGMGQGRNSIFLAQQGWNQDWRRRYARSLQLQPTKEER